MEYTITKLAQMSGVSSRTLRYYDEIGLLKPYRINSSGYRIYGEKEVDLLQQILLYRQLELPLEQVKDIILSEDFDCKQALYEHKINIVRRKEELDRVLMNIEKTLKCFEGGYSMTGEEKFEGLKRKMIDENESKYGKEIREKYGEEKVEESYKKFSQLTKKQWEEVEGISKEVNRRLGEVLALGDVKSEAAKEAVELHKKWVNCFWKCENEAHIGLGQMYVDDERFTEYYEKNVGKGAAKFLRDALVAYYNATFNKELGQWEIEMHK